MSETAVFICDAVRTVHGSFFGALKNVPSAKLGSVAIRALLDRSKFPVELINGVFMGEVLTAGEGQNPARHAALIAGLPYSCPAETFNKVCASSLAALRHATNMIRLGDASCMIAGGMENMSRAPYLVRRDKKGVGHKTSAALMPAGDAKGPIAYDSMIHDGLTEFSVEGSPHMGELADRCACNCCITRDEQDAFAYESFSRANYAQAHIQTYRLQQVYVAQPGAKMLIGDEGLRTANKEAMHKLQPVFSPCGSITAATSSQIADGASAVLLANEQVVRERSVLSLARIRSIAVCSQEPARYPTAPVGAIQKLLDRYGLTVSDIDLFEINEAFAVVPLYAMRALRIPHEKVNIWGGAIAIGHPLGASGTRIVGQLAHQLRALDKKRGIAVACNGGGEAVAVLIERV